MPTNDGLELVKRWNGATNSLTSARRQVSSAECELANAESELVKWLVPKDAKIGAVFCLPIGDAFVQILIDRKVSYGDDGKEHVEPRPAVSWRDGKRPSKEWMVLR